MLKKEKKDFQSACEYAEKSIRCRDSLEMNNKAGYISNLNAFQEHERQQRRIAQMNIELSEHELSYYRLAILLSFILLSGTSLVFRIKQSKKKVEMSLKEKELAKKPNYLTVPAAIRELEKIEMTRQLDKVYRLDHAVTKTQKVILSAFGMDWNHVKYRVENISKILKI